MLSPCGVPTGMEGNRTRIISRKCKTAETKCQSWELSRRQSAQALLCTLCASVVAVNVRGKKCCFPHATNKSHPSGRLSYKT